MPYDEKRPKGLYSQRLYNNWEDQYVEDYIDDYIPVDGPAGQYCEPLKFVSREEWGAKPPRRVQLIDKDKYPIRRVVWTFTTTDYTCLAKEECFKTLQALQEKQMRHGSNDIRYNFMVGRDGIVYEGRGWLAKSSKFLKYNSRLYGKRIDIGFIGDYSTESLPPVDMMEGALNIARLGIDEGYVHTPYKLVELRNLKERFRKVRRWKPPKAEYSDDPATWDDPPPTVDFKW